MGQKGKQKRSSLGGHWAGTGMVQPPDQQDDFIRHRGIKVHRPGMLPTDKFGTGEKGKKAFKAYCQAQSSDVKVYNIKDLETP